VRTLRELLDGVGVVALHGDASVPVPAVTLDSREAANGACFVAVPGTKVDGGDYARDAAAHGAGIVVSERPADPALLGRVVWVQVADARGALARIAAAFHGRPIDRLAALGVTGTNGKTTTTYLAEGALTAAGHRPGVIGTVEIRFGGRSEPAKLTTPDPIALHGVAARMVDAGVTHLVMEVSSHALALGRVEGIRFLGAAFTNLSQDHLDFHPTFEDYAEAKLRMFREHLAPGALAIVTADDPVGDRVAAVAAAAGARLARFSTRPGAAADLAVVEADYASDGTRAALRLFGERADVRSPLIGRHNLANILAAIGLAVAAGVPASTAARGACSVANIPGRLERIALPNGASAFVDYSHTPDALERALDTLRETARGRLWVILGCGGDRDRGKRPMMGRLAVKADRAILTSDNPRTEPPEAILDEIEAGARAAGMPRTDLASLAAAPRAYAREADRAKAIAAAVRAAAPDDVVLVAGKGHETYQIVGTTKRHFDDREEVRKAANSS